jgi:subtilase family serine protease
MLLNAIPAIPGASATGSRSPADVSVTGIILTPSIAYIGDNVTINATLSNFGTENATDITIEFEAGNMSLPPIDLGTVLLGDDNNAENVTGGGSVNVIVYWNTSEVGFEAQPNSWYSLNVTAYNSTDANNTNDTMRIPIFFKPDDYYLQVKDLAPQSNVVRIGDNLNITFMVWNNGSKTLNTAKTIKMFLDNATVADWTQTTDHPFPGKTGQDMFFDIDTSGIDPGNHTFTVKVFDIGHDDDGENATTDNITFTIPNVYIDEMTFYPGEAVVGDIVMINATIRNNGTADIEDVYVGFFVDLPYQDEAWNTTVNVTAGGTDVVTFEWNTTGAIVGNHTVRASLKPAWDSMNETENITLLAGGVIDLVMVNMSFDPATAEVGEIVNVSLKIRNDGDWPSTECNVSVSIIGLESQEIGKAPLLEILPGEYSDINVLWNTSGLSAMKYKIRAQADSDDDIDEVDEGNNHIMQEYELSARPDLTITTTNFTSYGVEVSNATKGSVITFNAKVENIGTLTSTKTNAQIFIDDEATPVLDTTLWPIGVGNYLGVQFIWDTSGYDPGNHTFTVKVDVNGTNDEIREDNNEAIVVFDLLPPVGRPDLQVLAFEISDTEPMSGDHIILRAHIKNIGLEDAINVSVRFGYATGQGGTEIYKTVEPLIKKNTETNVTHTWATGPFVPGNYNLFVSVDPLNEIIEEDEDNNYQEAPVTIRKRPDEGEANVDINKITISPEKPKRDEEVTITVEIINSGDGDAQNLVVVLFVNDIEQGRNTLATLAKNGTTHSFEFTWKAKEGKFEIRAEVFVDGSQTAADQRSEVLDVEAAETDFLPILLIIVPILIIAIILLALGGKKGRGEKEFIEDEDEDWIKEEE